MGVPLATTGSFVLGVFLAACLVGLSLGFTLGAVLEATLEDQQNKLND